MRARGSQDPLDGQSRELGFGLGERPAERVPEVGLGGGEGVAGRVA